MQNGHRCTSSLVRLLPLGAALSALVPHHPSKHSTITGKVEAPETSQMRGPIGHHHPKSSMLSSPTGNA